MEVEYKITVERIETDVPYKLKEYQVIDDHENEHGVHDRKYDYVVTDAVKDVSTKIFEQKVTELNLSDVVAVVNKITVKGN